MEQPRNMKYSQDRWEIDKVRYYLDKKPSPRRDIRLVSDILTDVIEGLEVKQCETVLVLQKVWSKLCGDQVAKHSTPGFIKQSVLYVRVDHPGWMPELERVKRMILRRLQDQYRELKIRNIHFILEHK